MIFFKQFENMLIGLITEGLFTYLFYFPRNLKAKESKCKFGVFRFKQPIEIERENDLSNFERNKKFHIVFVCEFDVFVQYTTM